MNRRNERSANLIGVLIILAALAGATLMLMVL